MSTALCEFEVNVLRVCAGEGVPGMQWGAAMGVALEFLKGSRYVTTKRTLGSGGCYTLVYVATDKGRELLKELNVAKP